MIYTIINFVTKHVDIDYAFHYSYDGLGRMHTLTYPDNDAVRYTYDTGGNLYQVINNADNTMIYAAYTGYNALGQPGTVAFKNGVDTAYTYYPANNLLHTIYTNSTSTTLLDLSYDVYDNVGNVITITDNTPRSTQAPRFDEEATYDYGLNGAKPHAVAHDIVSGITYSYDANGNMTWDGLRNIVYNYDNMPISITIGNSTTSFTYDGSGARVSKTTPDGPIIDVGNLYTCSGGVCAKYLFAGNTRLAHKVSNTDIVYYHPDQLGSTSAMSDPAGNKLEDIQYLPYGETRLDSGTVSMAHKYTAQEFDAETSLYYYNARYYNPSLGRFISADTIVPGAANPQAFNRYSYVLNNPFAYTDPTGHGNFFGDILDNILREASRFESNFRQQGVRADRERRITGREGVAGVLDNVNSQIDRTFGSSNDGGEALKYGLDAVIAVPTYLTLSVMTPDSALTDPSWQLSNSMTTINFTAEGQALNAGVTYYATGSPRFADPTKHGGYPVVENSMFGYIANITISIWPPEVTVAKGPAGFTPGSVSFVTPDADDKLIDHETGHQMQYDEWGGLLYLDRGRRNAGGNDWFEWDADYRATLYYNTLVYEYPSKRSPVNSLLPIFCSNPNDLSTCR